MKKLKIFLICLISFLVVALAIPGTAFIVLSVRTNTMLDDYSFLKEDPKYKTAVKIKDIPLVKQEISCGYAVMEMVSNHLNYQVTEESLFSQYNKITTSTGKGFEKEMNRQFTDYRTTMHRYLPNTKLLTKSYNSILNNMPVPFEWAAKYEDQWTLHFSLLIGLDFINNSVDVLNPYGFEEHLTIEDFLARTSYKAFKPMPGYLAFGFAFGVFEKNTIFIIESNAKEKIVFNS